MNPQPDNKPIKAQQNDDEIDLLELAKVVWNGRKTILKYTLLAGLLGVIIALLSPKEYTSSITMVPQTSSSGSKLGGLSSLAAMAGFNLDNASSGEALSPVVYPQIVSSSPFQLELMNMPFTFSEVNHPVSLYEYYSEIASPGVLSLIGKYTIGLPGVILRAIKGDKAKETLSVEKGPIALSGKQENIRKMMEAKINLEVDSKQGFLTLTTSFPEALLSAQVADQARELLQKYITRYKTEKATAQLNFIEERYQDKKNEFEKAQNQLARYRDQNKNMSSAIARTGEERLQSEYTIAMNVYNELAKQLEQSKIQVKEETPVFSILEPATIPNERSKPKRGMIVVIWLFLGGIAGIAAVFGKVFLKDVKARWKEVKE